MTAIKSANRVMPVHLKKPLQLNRKSRKSDTMRSRTAARDQRSAYLSEGVLTDTANQPLKSRLWLLLTSQPRQGFRPAAVLMTELFGWKQPARLPRFPGCNFRHGW